jgi:hypothetical protein
MVLRCSRLSDPSWLMIPGSRSCSFLFSAVPLYWCSVSRTLVQCQSHCFKPRLHAPALVSPPQRFPFATILLAQFQKCTKLAV